MQTVEERLLQKFNYHSEWHVRHWRKDDNGIYRIIWEDIAIDRNTLMQTGQQAILSAFFATAYANYGAPPANHYMALDSHASIADTDTLATLVEIVAKGYARKPLISSGTGVSGQDFYINKPAAYWRADGKVVEWTATADWVTAQLNIHLCTSLAAVVDGAGAHLIASLVLSAPRTLLNGDKLDGSMYLGLSN